MGFARHNEGKFDSSHSPTDPVIRSYDDAYSYLVRDPHNFQLEDAVRVHVFDIKLRENVLKLEGRRAGRYLTQREIDQFIDDRFSARDLDEVIRKAQQTLLEYREQVEEGAVRQFLSKVPPNTFLRLSGVGAWQGVCGNALSFVIVIAAVVLGILYRDTNLGQHLVNYYHSCVEL